MERHGSGISVLEIIVGVIETAYDMIFHPDRGDWQKLKGLVKECLRRKAR